MTDKQALAWARKRWGRNATVSANDRLPNENSRRRVGVIMLGMFFEVRGEGANWQAACDDALARAQRDHERYGAAKKAARHGAGTLPFIFLSLAIALTAMLGVEGAMHLFAECLALGARA